jgi:hypothetical protein
MRARLNTHQAWSQIRKELQHLHTTDPLADHHCAINTNAVDLKR